MLESWQRGEVQVPLAPSHLDVCAVVDLEVYCGVETTPEHVVEEPILPEIPDDEPFQGMPSPGDGLYRLPLSVDRKVDGEARAEGEVGDRVRGGLRQHVDHPGGLRRARVARLLHGSRVGRVRVSVLIYQAQVGLV